MRESNILLGPSLMLAKNTFQNTFDLARRFGKAYEEFRFYYPPSLLRLIGKESTTPDSPGIRFFLHNAKPTELDVLITYIKRYSHVIHSFEPTPEQISKYATVYEVLSEELEYRGELPDREDRDLCDILFEELIFLEERSWIVSRIKKPFNRFMAAGAACIHYGPRAVDALTRRTLRKEQEEIISNTDRLRAFGKWIAVGGASATALIGPAIAGVAVSATLGYFLLIDPEAESGRAPACLPCVQAIRLPSLIKHNVK